VYLEECQAMEWKGSNNCQIYQNRAQAFQSWEKLVGLTRATDDPLGTEDLFYSKFPVNFQKRIFNFQDYYLLIEKPKPQV
jgi:hypothetical protein